MDRPIWLNECNLPSFLHLKEDIKTDVLIIGGGIAGILCAYRLQSMGINYALIDADRICRGITCRTTAKITSQHGLIYQRLLTEFDSSFAREYWEANEWAVNAFRNLTQSIACDFADQDSIVYSADEDKLRLEMDALRRLEIPATHLDTLDIPIQAKGILFSGQAQFNPMKFLSQIVGDLRIYEHTAARSIEGNLVRTNHGNITANKIIVATHFPILNRYGGYFLKMYQERSYVMALKDAPVYMGMYRDAEKKGFSFRNAEDCLIIGSGSHRTGKKSAGWQELELFKERFFPKAQVVSKWAAQDCITLDGIPYIGQYSPHTPDLYVATGFNKWGMTASMLAANILPDLIQDKPNSYAKLFAPSRSVLKPQLLCNIMESTVNLLTPTGPRCPHMGCALKWNKHERTWDCPCHGSRFGEDGKLLNNPSINRLQDNQSH